MEKNEDCALITCPDTLRPAWMAQDGLCYCGHGEEQTYENVMKTGTVAVAARTQLPAKRDVPRGFDKLYTNVGFRGAVPAVAGGL